MSGSGATCQVRFTPAAKNGVCGKSSTIWPRISITTSFCRFRSTFGVNWSLSGETRSSNRCARTCANISVKTHPCRNSLRDTIPLSTSQIWLTIEGLKFCAATTALAVASFVFMNPFCVHVENRETLMILRPKRLVRKPNPYSATADYVPRKLLLSSDFLAIQSPSGLSTCAASPKLSPIQDSECRRHLKRHFSGKNGCRMPPDPLALKATCGSVYHKDCATQTQKATP